MAGRKPIAHASQTRAWRWIAFTGAALLVLVSVHMVANHFVVQTTGGLRTYGQVLDYIANPLIFAIESVFVVVVTMHAMLGIRSVLLDLGFGERGRLRIDRVLVALGTITVGYGFFLLVTLASRA